MTSDEKKQYYMQALGVNGIIAILIVKCYEEKKTPEQARQIRKDGYFLTREQYVY